MKVAVSGWFGNGKEHSGTLDGLKIQEILFYFISMEQTFAF